MTTARAVAASVRAGERSARQVVEEALAAVAARDGELHAFLTVRGEEALHHADAVDAAVAQGRDPGTFRVGKRVYINVDDDATRGRRRLEDALTRHYGGGEWSEHVVAGPPEACATGLRAVADAGAELILLNPLLEDARQLDRLAAEVIPALS